MSAQTLVPQDHPMMIAWNEYKQSDEYQNTRRWALHEAHVDGSLWAAFCQGFGVNQSHCAELEAKLARLPADWGTDSSLETWFPIAAERIAELEAENAALRERACPPREPPANVLDAIEWQLGPDHKIASTAKGIYHATRWALLTTAPHQPAQSEGE